MYSAPSSPGVLYWTHWPRWAMRAWPAVTSMVASRVVTRSEPCRTMVYSSNSGVWPGSIQPAGLRMRAMLRAAVFEFMRPMNSSIRLGLFPAAAMAVALWMCVGIVDSSRGGVRMSG